MNADRIHTERLRRARAAWKRFEPSVDEQARAYRRFVTTHARQRRSVRVGPWVLAALVVLSAGAAFATSGPMPRWLATHFSASDGAPSPASTLARRSRGAGARPPEPKNMPAPALVPSVAAVPPAGGTDSPTASAAATSPPVVASPLGAKVRPKLAPDHPTEPTSRSPWSIAAEALRARDYRTAERSFDELSRSGDTRTSDAGRLARAELWLTLGRKAAAQTELTALSTNGATALIRAQAAHALGQAE